MATKTYTLLVTVTSDEDECIRAPALADAIKGALETGIKHVLIGGVMCNVDPVLSAEVAAFDGDATHLMCVPMSDQVRLRTTRRLHASLRAA